MPDADCISSVRLCPRCASALVRKPREDDFHFNKRSFCGMSCARSYYAKRRHRAKVSGPPTDIEVERFWAKVDRSGGESACWIWTRLRTSDGYGMLSFRDRNVRAHRFSMMLAGAEVSKDTHVCHRCDNPPCVNPAHLFVGTNADNKADMVHKERQARGEKNAAAKLTDADVVAIRAAHAARVRIRDIERQFRIGKTQIDKIVRRKAWRHVP